VLLAVGVVVCLLAFPEAASTDQWDLFNFTTGVVIKDSLGNVVPPGGNVNVGENYTLHITFAESMNQQFIYNSSGFLSYQLPSSIVPVAVTNAPIYGTGAPSPVIGRCSVTSGGALTAKFDNVNAYGLPIPINFIDYYTTATFTVDITAKFNSSGGPVDFKFNFGNDIIITIVPKTKEPYPQITKSATAYDPNTKTIDYTVKVKAIDGTVTLDSFSDWATAAGLPIGTPPSNYLDFSTVKVDGVAVPSGNISWRAGSNPPVFDIAFPPAGVVLAEDQEMTVTYTIGLNDYLAANNLHGTAYSFNVFNEASVAYKDTNGNPQTRKAVNAVPVRSIFLQKSGYFTPDAAPATTGIITWTVTIGDGVADLAGMAVTDTLGAGFVSGDRPAAVDIIGQSALYGPAIWTENGVPTNRPGTGRDFSFDIPDDKGPVYYATVTINIPIDTTSVYKPSDKYYRNSVTVGTTTAEGSAWVNDGSASNAFDKYATLKTVKYLDADTLQYTIKFKVPASAFLTNKSDGSGKKNAPYLDDWLSMYASPGYPGYYVANVPENFQVTFNGELYAEGQEPYGYVLESYPNDEINGLRWLFGFHGLSGNGWWPDGILEDTEVVITYELRLSAPLMFTPAERAARNVPDHVMTLGELMRYDPREEVVNRISTCISGENGAATQYAIIGWPVFKNLKGVTVTEGTDTIFNFEVVINPSGPTLSGNGRSYRYLNGTAAAFAYDTTAVFFDEFDPRLEYVDGSFMMTTAQGGSSTDPYGGGSTSTFVYPSSSNTYGPPGYPPLVFGPTISGTNNNILTAHLDDLRTDPLSRYNFYTNFYSQGTIVVRYQLKLKDTVKAAMEDQIELSNTAGFVGTSIFTGSFATDYKFKYGKRPVEKDMVDVDGNIATFEIVVNPYAKQFDGGSNLCVTDRMNPTLAFYLSTIKAFTGSDLDVPLQPPLRQTAELDPEDTWSWTLTGENEVTFVIPDATPVKLRYDALIIGTPGENANLVNYVEVSGMYFDEYKETYQVQSYSFTGNGERKKFTLLKHDSTNIGKLLPDAHFALYMGHPGTWANPYGGNPPPSLPPGVTSGAEFTQVVNGTSYTFYYLAEGTTDSSGTILFDDAWLANKHVTDGARYAVVEITPPPGYETPVNNTMVVDILSVTGTDYVTIPNKPLTTDVTLNGNKILQGSPPATTFYFDLLQVSDATGQHPSIPLNKKSTSRTGAGPFSFTLEGLGPGTYYYMVTETPGAPNQNWSYDNNAYIAKVTVSAGQNGALTPSVEFWFRVGTTGPWTLWNGSTMDFTNAFGTQAVDVNIPVRKTVADAGPAEPFSFKLTQVSDSGGTTGFTPVPSMPADETVTYPGGVSSFSDDFGFTVTGLGPGAYYFLVQELPPGASWSADLQYLVEVKVSSSLAVTLSYKNKAFDGSGSWSSSFKTFTSSNPIAIANTFEQPQSASVTIKGRKILGAGAPTTTDFNFELQEVTDASGTTTVGSPLFTSCTGAPGDDTFTFLEITGLIPGQTYYYTMREIDDGLSGWSYDPTVYLVIVEVTGSPPYPKVTGKVLTPP